MRVLLAGFGSVGRGVARMLEARRDELYSRMGLSPRLVGVLDSTGCALRAGGLDAATLIAAKTASGSVGALPDLGTSLADHAATLRLIADTQADVFVESTPSVITNPQPAFERIKAALSSGKHVVSVNKAPLAMAMPALEQLARFNKVAFRYSGTVGAATPVLATAHTLAQGDRIMKIRGILNGTTNFILWRMSEHGDDYHAALAEAVRLGYAETDPSNDVDGVDTATKVVIIANSVLKMNATIQDVRVRGIRDMDRLSIERARAKGERLKLIGEIDAQSRTLSVAPMGVPQAGPMDVPANLNAVQFTLASAGEVTLVGRGAGGEETATAIVRDLVDIWHAMGH